MKKFWLSVVTNSWIVCSVSTSDPACRISFWIVSVRSWCQIDGRFDVRRPARPGCSRYAGQRVGRRCRRDAAGRPLAHSPDWVSSRRDSRPRLTAAAAAMSGLLAAEQGLSAVLRRTHGTARDAGYSAWGSFSTARPYVSRRRPDASPRRFQSSVRPPRPRGRESPRGNGIAMSSSSKVAFTPRRRRDGHRLRLTRISTTKRVPSLAVESRSFGRHPASVNRRRARCLSSLRGRGPSPGQRRCRSPHRYRL